MASQFEEFEELEADVTKCAEAVLAAHRDLTNAQNRLSQVKGELHWAQIRMSAHIEKITGGRVVTKEVP